MSDYIQGLNHRKNEKQRKSYYDIVLKQDYDMVRMLLVHLNYHFRTDVAECILSFVCSFNVGFCKQPDTTGVNLFVRLPLNQCIDMLIPQFKEI